MVRCPGCRAEVSEWAAHCPACGADLGAASSVEAAHGSTLSGDLEVLEPWDDGEAPQVGGAARVAQAPPSNRSDRPQHQRLRLSVGAAVLVTVVAAGGALLVALGRHGHSVSDPRRPPPTVPSVVPTKPTLVTPTIVPNPSGIYLVDLTWISDERGWSLISIPCPAGTCATILATADGGQSWSRTARVPDLSKNPTARGCILAGCFDHLRFTSLSVGYLWGRAVGLFVTADGGQSWTSEPASQLFGLEPTQHYVVRVVAPGGFGSAFEVDRAPSGSNQWTRLPTEVGLYGSDIFTAGPALYIAWPGDPAGRAPDSHTHFIRSFDGGATWTSFRDPCGQRIDGTELDASAYAATTSGSLAVLCTPRSGSGTVWFAESSDSGDHFGLVEPVPIDTQATLQLALAADGQAALVASTATASAPARVLRSTDGGNTWVGVLAAPSATIQGVAPWFGFEDATTGRVSFGANSLWTTTDGGQSWSEELVPPSV